MTKRFQASRLSLPLALLVITLSTTSSLLADPAIKGHFRDKPHGHEGQSVRPGSARPGSLASACIKGFHPVKTGGAAAPALPSKFGPKPQAGQGVTCVSAPPRCGKQRPARARYNASLNRFEYVCSNPGPARFDP